jgi:hypothetical protein
MIITVLYAWLDPRIRALNVMVDQMVPTVDVDLEKTVRPSRKRNRVLRKRGRFAFGFATVGSLSASSCRSSLICFRSSTTRRHPTAASANIGASGIPLRRAAGHRCRWP